SYSVGDRIEIDGMRGDVIRYGLLTTTLLEIGPAHQKTGRTVVFPNSMLLSNRLVNETSTHAYVLHTFVVPVGLDQNWQQAERDLLEIARGHAGHHREAALRHMGDSARRHGLEAPNVEAVVSLQIPEAGKLNLLVRIPAPALEKGRLERLILREFLQRRHPERPAEPGRSTPG
ncbi:MAG: mechanosensitive ion channel family protein, partial [Planctomycetes bacterium]|nr:mechanosensitive ion channel family protein [Planctomycetota bacterium]